MADDDLNSTRAGRSIENLDDRKGRKANPGDVDPTGKPEPDYSDDILEYEENAALDHVQISGVGDIAADGETVYNDLPPSRPKTGKA
jgi:hypothetical protein